MNNRRFKRFSGCNIQYKDMKFHDGFYKDNTVFSIATQKRLHYKVRLYNIKLNRTTNYLVIYYAEHTRSLVFIRGSKLKPTISDIFYCKKIKN